MLSLFQLTQTPLTALMQQVESVEMETPPQAAPPHEGAGLVHERVLVRDADPHEEDQPPMSQADQPPLTAVDVKKDGLPHKGSQ